MTTYSGSELQIPWFGARKMVRALNQSLQIIAKERDEMRQHLERLGAMSNVELEKLREKAKGELKELISQSERTRIAALEEEQGSKDRLAEIRRTIVATDELTLLQEAGVYRYRHPLTDAVQFESRLAFIDGQIKEMVKKDGGAILAAGTWSINGSESQGRAMVRDYSKLMLRAFNAEADNLVRGLKPYKLDAAIERLKKVADTIERLGKIMQIRISPAYEQVRIQELELTADFLQKEAEEKEAERVERERLREERKAQQEIERERARLEKERQHYENALGVLVKKGDSEGVARLQAELQQVEKAIQDVDYRAANIRAGYVYVISNIGSFGESVVKIGMTRRLDPMDRIRELSDASVPFNFDVHALFFSKDAVGIETAMHERLADLKINLINQRREFFRATPVQVKAHLAELAGELLQFQEVAEALEYRQCISMRSAAASNVTISPNA